MARSRRPAGSSTPAGGRCRSAWSRSSRSSRSSRWRSITILPDIEDDLGGIAWYGWVTTAFFLGTMIGIVFAGDQADRRGAGPAVRAAGWCCSPSGSSSAGWRRRCRCSSPAGSCRASAPASSRRSATWRSGGRSPSRPGRGCSPSCRRRGSCPACIGPVLAERVAGTHRLAVGVPRAAAARRRRRVARRAGDDAARARCRGRRRPSGDRDGRRRMVEAVRVAAGAALVVASFTASRWLLVPGRRRRPAHRPRAAHPPDPAGHAARRPGLPAVILSRGLLTFAFFGTDTFVPYALHQRPRQRRRSPGASPSPRRRWRGRSARGSRTAGSRRTGEAAVRPPRLPRC